MQSGSSEVRRDWELVGQDGRRDGKGLYKKHFLSIKKAVHEIFVQICRYKQVNYSPVYLLFLKEVIIKLPQVVYICNLKIQCMHCD